MTNFRILFLLWIVISFVACQNENMIAESSESYQFLHLSHTRLDDNASIDETVDFDQYDVLMLGGDLAQVTSADAETMNSLDVLFDFSEPSTLWSLGNHDYSNLELIEAYTGRLPYYSYHHRGVTFLVLDTQAELSQINGGQLDFFNSVTDTIVESSYLILMTHKLFWMPGNKDLESEIADVANGPLGSCDYCTNPSNFYEDIYPKLVELEGRGVEVICVGGDIGSQVNQFSFETEEGIDFLASGIESGDNGNRALVFGFNPVNRLLKWHFVKLEEI